MIAKTYKNGAWHELSGQKIYANGAFQTLQDNNLLFYNNAYFKLNGDIQGFFISSSTTTKTPLVRPIFNLEVDKFAAVLDHRIPGYGYYTSFVFCDGYIWLFRYSPADYVLSRLYFSDNYGTTWSSVISGSTSNAIRTVLQFNNEYYAIMCYTSGYPSIDIRKKRTTDAIKSVQNWEVKHHIYQSVNVTGISENYIFAASPNRMVCIHNATTTVAHSNDYYYVETSTDGETWTRVATLDFTGYTFLPDIIFLEYLPLYQKWIFGHASAIYLSTNETATAWEEVSASGPTSCAHSTIGNYIVYAIGSVIKATNGSGTFTTVLDFTPATGGATCRGIIKNRNTGILYAACGQYLYSSTDGINWNSLGLIEGLSYLYLVG